MTILYSNQSIPPENIIDCAYRKISVSQPCCLFPLHTPYIYHAQFLLEFGGHCNAGCTIVDKFSCGTEFSNITKNDPVPIYYMIDLIGVNILWFAFIYFYLKVLFILYMS